MGVAAATKTVIVEEPDPGAAIEAGLKLAVAPPGNPAAESDMAELKLPDTDVEIVEVPELPCAIESDAGADDIEKSLLVEGLKMISMTG